MFFATRTPAMPDAPDGYRYWRFVELPDQKLVSTDLQILRRIDPHGGEPAEFEGIDLEAAWETAAADIVITHNERTDLRAVQEQIGPKQRWALELLRDPGRRATTRRRPGRRRARSGAEAQRCVVRIGEVQDRVLAAGDLARRSRCGNRSASSRTLVSNRSRHRHCRRRSPPTTSAWSAGWRCCLPRGTDVGLQAAVAIRVHIPLRILASSSMYNSLVGSKKSNRS